LVTSSCSNFSISLSHAFTSGNSLYLLSGAQDKETNIITTVRIKLRLMTFIVCFDKGSGNLLKYYNNAITLIKVLLYIAGKLFILCKKKLRLYLLDFLPVPMLL
jgi:hypothetical protein